MSETYTEAGLKRKNLSELGTIASDQYGIDPETHEDKASLIAAILAGQEAFAGPAINDDDDPATLDQESLDDDEPIHIDTDEPEHEPDLPEGLVFVVGNGPADRTAYWERHGDHPGGEVFVKGGQRTTAALTNGIQRAARDNRIRIVDGK